ncbi:hypothetical protein Desdi_3342 [Desulfitobacterium dichloroeliminans LMG P-21439]|uniref:Uncharacterized protein n=2 Tax=Desulfitobacterium dichloroeliminans TaxID=233055 RepID=L0FDJ9_DESDL|nr:hypothetical protein Desdi_3342 [Desulfitobacterium dichloroeliminans LMG P-21439]
MNSNYMDKNKIVFYYNQSVELFNAYSRRDSEDASYKTLSLLNQAGTSLYQVFEAALKRYLVLINKEAYNNGQINWSEFQNNKKSIENMQRPDLIEMLGKQDPHLHNISIDYEIINRNAFSITNRHKHELSNTQENSFRLVLPEVKRFILAYVDPDAQLELDSSEGSAFSMEVNNLFEETDFFQGNGRWNYVLVTDALSDLTDSQKRAITHIKWAQVLDFDRASEQNGLAAAYHHEHKLQALKFDPHNPERTEFNCFSPTPYWFYLNGLVDLPATVVGEEDFRKWGQRYGSKLYLAFQRYHAVFEKPIKVVILSSSIRKVKKVIEALDQVYEENVQFLILSSPASYSEFGEPYVIKPLQLSAAELANSILANSSIFKILNSTYSCMMPAKNGTLVSVVPGLFNHFDLVHNDVAENNGDFEGDEYSELFYQGRVPLSWYGAKFGFAISRNETATKLKKLIYGLDDSYGIFHVIHEPGIGGSTFARTMAYSMRLDYPICMLKQYTKETTAKQVNNLYNLLRTTIIVVIDSSMLTQDQVNAFANELKPLAFPFVIVYIRRRRSNDRNAYQSVFLSSLNDYECLEMKKRLEPFASQETLAIIDDICHSPSRISERSPFFMALYTFEENFVGIKPYIRTFLKSMNNEQKKILIYLSIADKYANRPINESFFPRHLITFDEEEDKDTFFKKDSPFNDLLILKSTDSSRSYCLRHPLFADEIIEQTVYEGPDGSVLHQAAKANNLIRYLIEFIQISKTNSVVDYDTTLDVMKNLFILKDKTEIIQDKFSPLISIVKSMMPSTQDGENGVGIIFKTLVDTYPDEPHFVAHLARFYTLVEKNYLEGIRLAKDAISLSESLNCTDPLLYHICGVNISRQIKDEYKRKIFECHEYDETKNAQIWVERIKNAANEALDMFKTTRLLNNQVPGYVSAIDLCIDIVDIGKSISKDDDSVEFIRNNQGEWYMWYLDEALSLMDALRSVEDDSDFSRSTLQAKLDNLVGELDKTVLMWEKFLQQAKTSEITQVRRFLARAKQSQLRKRGYDVASSKDIDDIMALMVENIREDPNNAANIRIWFDTVRYCSSKDPELLLDEAISNLSVWKATTGSVEAYYYYFILICIKAIEGASRAEADIPFLQTELKQKAEHRYNNRQVFEWLGEGKGLGRLRKYSAKQIREDNAVNLERLTGRIINYKNPGNATLSSHNMEVFFNPSRAKQRFDSEDIGKLVSFGVGFSYDGLRAYDQSVVESGYNVESETTNSPVELQVGMRVKCRVIRNVDFYTQVKLVDYHNQDGSIHVNELGDDYSAENRPVEGAILFATVKEQRETGSRQQKFRRLSLVADEQENVENMPAWKRKLLEYGKNQPV